MNMRQERVTADGVPYVIRQATPGDAQKLLNRIRDVQAERLDGLVTQPEEFAVTLEQEQTWIRGLVESDNSTLLLAEHEHEIVGWVDVRGGLRLSERHTATLGIAVAKPWRGRGMGTALIETAIQWAAANPILEKLKLAVVATNDGARRLYVRFGFVEEGYQPRELKKPDGTYRDNVLMYRLVK